MTAHTGKHQAGHEVEGTTLRVRRTTQRSAHVAMPPPGAHGSLRNAPNGAEAAGSSREAHMGAMYLAV